MRTRSRGSSPMPRRCPCTARAIFTSALASSAAWCAARVRPGSRIGEMALRILTGTRARTCRLKPHRWCRVVDWRQLQRWGIAGARLPAGRRVLFREPSAWERYKVYIVGAVTALFAQAALIAGLLIQRARRRKAEQEVPSKSGSSAHEFRAGSRPRLQAAGCARKRAFPDRAGVARRHRPAARRADVRHEAARAGASGRRRRDGR